ncbi:MAG: ArsR/SmtB family transcription factor [Candidatus Njordarchaeum guaymaensis]
MKKKKIDLVPFFDALAHPIRLRIIKALLHKEKFISELAKELQISRPLLYMHLNKLERVGIVTTYIKHFDKPPYARKYIKANILLVKLLLPELELEIVERSSG